MNDDLTKRQKDMYHGLWFATIILIIILIAFWSFPKEIDMDQIKKIIWTIVIIVTTILAWIFFYNQKRIDEKKLVYNEGTKKDLFEGINISHGIYWRYRAVGLIATAIMFLIISIYILMFERTYWWLSVILLFIVVLIPIAVKNSCKVGGQKMKGRYY